MCPLCRRAVADGAHRYRITIERTGLFAFEALDTKALVKLHVCEACALQTVAALDSEALAVMTTTTWACNHTQTTSKRCIRCCSSKPKYYVLRRAAGGSPAAYRWLCQPCFDVYEQIGLVEGFAPQRLMDWQNGRTARGTAIHINAG